MLSYRPYSNDGDHITPNKTVTQNIAILCQKYLNILLFNNVQIVLNLIPRQIPEKLLRYFISLETGTYKFVNSRLFALSKASGGLCFVNSFLGIASSTRFHFYWCSPYPQAWGAGAARTNFYSDATAPVTLRGFSPQQIIPLCPQ